MVADTVVSLIVFIGRCFNRIELLGDDDGKILFGLAARSARGGSSNRLPRFSPLVLRPPAARSLNSDCAAKLQALTRLPLSFGVHRRPIAA
jgi:hypothetical protein